MVREKHENLAFGVTLQDFTVAAGRLISSHDVQEVLWGYSKSAVVDRILNINVLTVWSVEYLALKWVLVIRGDIVVGHQNDVLFWNAILGDDLISMVSIRLVPVVPHIFRACHDDGPVV